MGSVPEPQIFSAEQRPDLAEALASDPEHPLNQAWPAYSKAHKNELGYWAKVALLPELRRFKFAAVERGTDGAETIVAWAAALPFFWPELAATGGHGPPSTAVLRTLPSGGWDTILARGVRQACARVGIPTADMIILTPEMRRDLATGARTEPPNALAAMSVTVHPDRRGCALADRCIATIKDAARTAGLGVVVVPLRPTRKSEHPHVPMEEYIHWKQERRPEPSNGATRAAQDEARRSQAAARQGGETGGRWRVLAERYIAAMKAAARAVRRCTRAVPLRAARGNEQPRVPTDMSVECTGALSAPELGDLPYDPWLRKHVRAGGRIAHIAPSSLTIRASVAEWEAWTGLDLNDSVRNLTGLKMERSSGRKYTEVVISKALVPLKVYTDHAECLYEEPNVWVYHAL